MTVRNGLYIHIPFCVAKCSYCDFLSFSAFSKEQMRGYTGALINEIKSHDCIFETVYIGGGTPTALPSPFLLEIIEAINFLPGAEFTVEMNPGTRVPFQALKARGVNRLSIGLQAWQDSLLSAVGRIHTLDEFKTSFHAARQAGFNNISVDVMFALPGQTMDMWRETLYGVIDLKPEHISAYSLTPEEGTPLWQKLERGELLLPGDETDRAMYHAARKILSSAGYVHYEISNFALPGYASRHNARYWRREPYVGAGLGASSFNGRERFRNTDDMAEYIGLNGLAPRREAETLTARDAAAEEMFLGLRFTEGVPYNPFFAAEIEALINRGLIARQADNIMLTGLGLDLANQVFQAFIE